MGFGTISYRIGSTIGESLMSLSAMDVGAGTGARVGAGTGARVGAETGVRVGAETGVAV